MGAGGSKIGEGVDRKKRPSGYTVLVDGYNVIKRNSAFDSLSLEAGRKRLVTAMMAVPWGFPVERIVVVFDGPESSSSHPSARLTVQYAAPSADDFIRSTIQASAYPRHLAVVSDDREVQYTAKIHGARCLSTSSVRARAATPGGTKINANATDIKESSISAVQLRLITDELRKRWLKNNDD